MRYQNKKLLENNKIAITINTKDMFNVVTINSDTYYTIYPNYGERYDILADKYFNGDSSLYWIIKKVNKVIDASLFVDIDKYQTLLIPKNYLKYLS